MKLGSAIFYFTLYGIFELFLLKKEAILNLDGYLFSKIMTVISVGFLFGNICSFIMCYLLKLTSKVYQIKISVKNIANVFISAYRTHIISSLLIFYYIILSHYNTRLSQPDNEFIILIILVLRYLINLSLIPLGFFTLYLKIKKLKLLQNLSLIQTLFTLIMASLIFSPIYYLLLKL